MTTKLPSEFYLPLWEEAKAREIGVEIKVHPEDQHLLINALYECRKTVGGFEELIIMQPEPPGTIFIMHKTTEVNLP